MDSPHGIQLTATPEDKMDPIERAKRQQAKRNRERREALEKRRAIPVGSENLSEADLDKLKKQSQAAVMQSQAGAMTRRMQNMLTDIIPSVMREATNDGPTTVEEAEEWAKRGRGKKTDTPLFIQDNNKDGRGVILDSILGNLTDAPIEQVQPVKRKLNWNSDRALLYTLECCEHVMDVFLSKYPGETSITLLIEVGKRHARGEASEEHVAQAMKKVAEFATTMPDTWSGAGEAAGAVWQAVTGKFSECLQSCREAAFGRATGERKRIEDDDPWTVPSMGAAGMVPRDTRGMNVNEDPVDPLLERFHEDPNPWASNRKAALEMAKSPAMTAEFDERAWQLELLQEYLLGKKAS